MITPVYRGENLRRLLGYLYGPGRCEDHHDPHLIAAWDPQILATMDPARVPGATLTDLARLLDAPVKAHPEPERLGRYVWHCAARVAPQDRNLTDLDWEHVAQQLLGAAGIAPAGDDAACRWIAVRHADNHIHIAATLIRQDGRRPRHHNDWLRLRREAAHLESELGLRSTAPADRTARKHATRQEIAKADRLGLAEPARDTLARAVRQAVVASASELEFFLRLSAAGLHIHQRTDPAGTVTGYAVALPEHRSADGRLVWFAGSRLAPDLSLPKIRDGLAGKDLSPVDGLDPSGVAARLAAWRQAERRLHHAASLLTRAGDPAGAGLISGLNDLLIAAARQSPDNVREQLNLAVATFDRAARAPVGTVATPPAIQLRRAARSLIRAGRAAGTGHEVEAVLAVVLALTLAGRAGAAWHAARNYRAQAEAAHQASAFLQQAADDLASQTRSPARGTDTRRPTRASQRHRLARTAYAETVRVAIQGDGKLVDQILGDPAWPTLQRSLHRLATLGLDLAAVLADATFPRELASARSPAKVLHWRITMHLDGTAAERPAKRAEQLQLH